MSDPERAHELGRRGEDLAAAALAARGFDVLDRNVRLAHAEVDLIARDAAGLVFVEVKTRRRAGWYRPYDAVTDEKRERLRGAALEYLESRGFGDIDFRFGVVSIIEPGDGSPARIEWIDEA